MKNATSVKDRLKNYAKEHNRIVQDIFTVYVLDVIEAICNKDPFDKRWDHMNKEWKNIG